MLNRLRKNALGLAGVVLLVPVLGLLVAGPSWARVIGVEVEAEFDGYRNPENDSDEFHEMQAASEDVRNRISRKEVVVANLRAGQLSLAAATAEFMTLNRDKPETLAVIRDLFAGDTDREKMARNVIDFALIREPDPAAKQKLAGRLDAELHELIREYHPEPHAR